MLTKQEKEKDWRNYALINLTVGLLSMCAATGNILMGLLGFITESAWVGGSILIFLGHLYCLVGLFALDNFWPWINHKISEFLD